MNDLEKYFHGNEGRPLSKWKHYFAIYERHLAPYRHRPVRMLEIGVDKGGSLQMWKHYLGPQAEIVGVDIDPVCKNFAEERIAIEIGDQADAEFWSSFKKKYPPFDIILDDGGHTMEQQITSLDCLFEHVVDGGVYLVEDLCTSYWVGYGGGLGNEFSFIEHSKSLVDKLNVQYAAHFGVKADDFANQLGGLHFYTGMLVLDRVERKGETPVICGRDYTSGKPGAMTVTEDKNFWAEVDTYVYTASWWRLAGWMLKVVLYTLLGQRRKACLYATQLKLRLKNKMPPSTH